MTVFVFHQKVQDAKAKKAAIEKNPIVEFNYPSSKSYYADPKRLVRLISADEKYFLGLDMTDRNRFKKFLRLKAHNFRLVEFSPESMS